MKKTLPIILTVLFGLSVFLFIITFSIGLPIYCRFFYYLQIEPLGIPKATGYSVQQIKSAYDQVLNYLTLPNTEFSAGVFTFSPEGASHFADCKGLFTLNTVTLLCSTIALIILLILNKKGVAKLYRPFGFSASFISAVSIFVFFILIAIIVAVDFNSAFITFHHLFFPGKDNWTFDPNVDQIITALPQQFFMNCAILIVASIICLSVGIIIFQVVKKKKLKND
ncbi:MAG: TIGR01906 family membrane protein [Clostridiales bacterium]|nr:TIGR01906 family membrane protein [Clostridiales bacterium]